MATVLLWLTLLFSGTADHGDNLGVPNDGPRASAYSTGSDDNISPDQFNED